MNSTNWQEARAVEEGQFSVVYDTPEVWPKNDRELWRLKYNENRWQQDISIWQSVTLSCSPP